MIGASPITQGLILGQPTQPTVAAPKSQYVTAQEEEARAIKDELITTSTLPSPDLLGAFNTMQAEGEDPAAALSALQDIGQKQTAIAALVAKGGELTYEDVMNAGDPAVTGAHFKRELRRQQAASILQNIIEASDDSVVDAVNEFLYDGLIDPIVTAPDALTGQGGMLSAMAGDFQAALNLPDEEWNKFLEELPNKTSNPDFLQRGLTSGQIATRMLAGLEVEGYAKGDAAWAALNSALAIVPEVPGVFKAGKRVFSGVGKSQIAAIRAARGTEEGTKAAIALTQNGGAKTAAVAEDIMPGALAAPEKALPAPVAPQATPVAKGSPKASGGSPKGSVKAPTTHPASQAMMAISKGTNRFIETIKQSENIGSYGLAGWTDDVAKWAAARGAAVAKASTSNLVDVSVVENMNLGNFKASFTFGKDGGGGFTTYNTALNISKSIPNSVIVDGVSGLPVTKGVPGGNYFVKSELPIEVQVGAHDMPKNKLGLPSRLFGRHGFLGGTFASSNRGIQEELNNLAFQGDYGQQKNLKFIETEFKGSVNKLTTEEQETLGSIFRSIQDNPRSDWLSNAEFTNDYINVTGTVPRKEVIQVYELAVEASDAAWWVQASEYLTAMNKKNTLMFSDKPNLWVQIYPDKSVRSTIGKVKNAKTGKLVDADSLPPETIIYKRVEGKQGVVSHVYNVQGMTRLPTHADALPYNAGGPRSNPYETHFIGALDTAYVDPATKNLRGKAWGTVGSARSEKDAAAMVSELNTVVDGWKAKGLTLDPRNPYAGLGAAGSRALDDLVQANNKWNPQIENWGDFVEFMAGRGVKIGDAIVWKERGASLKQFIDYQDDFLIHKNLDNLIQYKRHDLGLISYGGQKTYNDHPVQSIVRQLQQNVSAAAHLQWKVEHLGRFMAKLEKFRDANKSGQVLEIDNIGPYTDEVNIRHMVIKGNSDLAVQLRWEQSVIVRRLDAFVGSSSESAWMAGLRGAWTGTTDKVIEAIHDIPWQGLQGKIVAPMATDARNAISNKAMSIGFMTKMTNPASFVTQAMGALQATAISPVNGVRAAILSGYVREIARHPQGPTLWGTFMKNVAKAVDLDPVELQHLLDHFAASGRGFAKGAVIEDPEAIPGFMGGRAREGWEGAKAIARTPYYLGENFSQTVSRITAYLDTIKRLPKANRTSKEFWNAVAERDRTLSLNMNKSSASIAQTNGLTRFLTQFTSFHFRALETVFFDGKLTMAERGRLAASLSVLWGWAGMGLPDSWFEGGDGTNSGFFHDFFKYGPIDTLLKNTIGITIGSRVGVKVAEDPVFHINIPSLLGLGSTMNQGYQGPAGYNIAATGASAAWSSLTNFVTGREQLGTYDLERLVRVFKIVDDNIMAYQMIREQTRITAAGRELPANYTTTEALFQALGFQPNKAQEATQLRSKSFNAYQRQQNAIKAALPSMKMSIKLGKEGDWGGMNETLLDASAIIDAYGLPPSVRADTMRSVIREANSDDFERIVMSCLKAGCSLDAINFIEGLK